MKSKRQKMKGKNPALTVAIILRNNFSFVYNGVLYACVKSISGLLNSDETESVTLEFWLIYIVNLSQQCNCKHLRSASVVLMIDIVYSISITPLYLQIKARGKN